LKTGRIREIEEYIRNKEIVSLSELCETFGISMNTVRRDINELVSRGSAKKVYGGVCAVSRDLIPYDERESKNAENKKRIAKAAAALVKDGDIIFIDSGTTTHHMVSYLKDKRVTILTDSLNVCLDALAFPNISVITPGGPLSRKTSSFSGWRDYDFMRDINIKKAFMAATGVSISDGVTNSSPEEYEIKKRVVNKSDSVYLLADSSKFDRSSMMTFCRMNELNSIITEAVPPQEYVNYCADSGIEIVVAE
jgi:DeoR family myo-inositol catabolism operon transcriptional repressor